jgi:hypothetical protein
MIGSTMSGETAKLSPSTFRFIERIFEMLTMVSLGVGLLLLSYHPGFLIVAFLVALFFGGLAYYCALQAKLGKSKPSDVHKPSGIKDLYLIDATRLEKMTADGVPWDVVAALAGLIDLDSSSPPNKKPAMTEVELIQQLVSLKCDLERINQFRRKILKNTKVENTIDPPTPSDTPPSKTEPAAPTNTLEPAAAVRAP